MKLKTLGRVDGTARTAVFGYLLYKDIDFLSTFPYSQLFLGDYPVELKVTAGAVLAAGALLIPPGVLGAMDGLTDMAKGTHHYFGMRLYRNLVKSHEKRERIDRETEYMLRATKIR